MEVQYHIITVKGKRYAVDLVNHILFNIDNPRDRREMDRDMYDYFKELVGHIYA